MTPTPFPHRSGTVLIVDDDPTVRATLCVALREVADRVMACDSAEEAERIMHRSRVDLLCVDKNLPGMNGLQFIAHVRATDAAVGILVITGYGTIESARASLDLGVDGYVEKPFDVERLLLSCQTTLARCARRREAIRREGAQSRPHTGLALAPHDILAATLERSLKDAGLSVLRTDAVETPDLVLIALDGARGMAARVSELRRRYPAAELMVLSGLYDVPTLAAFMDLGVAATLDLPLDREQLALKLESVAGERPEPTETVNERF